MLKCDQSKPPELGVWGRDSQPMITNAITTLAEAERRFHLSRTEAENFFPEWRTNLPDLTEAERVGVNELRRRYIYQRTENNLLEGTVMLLLASPLLALAGFYEKRTRA